LANKKPSQSGKNTPRKPAQKSTAARKTAAKNSQKQGGVNLVAIVFILVALFGGFGIYLENNSARTADVTAKAAVNPVSSGVMEVNFIDVGQGSSALITDGEFAVLIDGGEAEFSETVIDFIKAKNIKKLDYVFATHPHSDHIGGLPEVIDEFAVDEIIMPKIPDEDIPTTKIYENFLDAADRNDTVLTETKAGDIFSAGQMNFTVLSPEDGESYSDLNDYSTVLMLSYGDTRWLFTGDAEKPVEKALVESGANLSADVLAVGHHGSSNSSTADFLAEVSPQIAVISCGKGNDYGHPTDEALSRLGEYTDRIFRTDISGTIIFKTNGETIAINEISEREENGYSGEN
jgi:competence protein ComEC